MAILPQRHSVRKSLNWQMIKGLQNPFQGDVEELMNIGTGGCGSEEVVKALRSMESLGQKQYKNFVKTVIEDRTHSFSHGELSPHRSLLW